MLREITIKGFDIIDNINVTFSPGLNIVTGETGAGKSLIVEAIQQLLGSRASSEMVKSDHSKAQIIGVFDLPQKKELIDVLEENGIEPLDELIILREIANTGKSILKINGITISTTTMRNISKYLANISNQMAAQDVLLPHYQLEVLDQYGRLSEYKERFKESFLRWKSLKEKKENIEKITQNRLQELDFINYQIEELQHASLIADEDETLKEEENRLLNLERLKNDVQEAYNLLYEEDNAAIPKISKASEILSRLDEIEPQLGPLGRDLENQSILLSDIARTLRTYISRLNDIDISALEEVESRINFINELKRKYRVKSVNELLKTLDSLRSKKESLEREEEEDLSLSIAIEEAYKEMEIIGEELSRRRDAVAPELSNLLSKELRYLGMPNVRISLVINRLEEPTQSGFNSISFLIATSPDEPLKKIEDVVSGGELSRISLVIKSIAKSIEEPSTLIFDEIDIGIGGKVALAVGEKIFQLSRTSQVINITHLPQIAAFADSHIYIQKDIMDSGKLGVTLKVLDDKERILEISRMLTGQVMDTTIVNARELIDYVDRLKTGGTL
jgi:DNA repair protein RecN (Recombination protein N)